MVFKCYGICMLCFEKLNEGRNDIKCYAMVWHELWTETPLFTEEFQPVHNGDKMTWWDKSYLQCEHLKNTFKSELKSCCMLCYGMVRVYEIVCYRIIFQCYSLKLQCYTISFQSCISFCYCKCCKRYAWTNWTL